MTTLGSNNLTERAMLVNLSLSVWTATKNDKSVNREVAANHGSDERMGRYNKTLIDKAALDVIKKCASSMRTEHYARTLPWRDNGDRILSSLGYFDYSEKMRQLIAQFESGADSFSEPTTYTGFVQDAKRQLNGLWSADDYPTPDKIRSKFSAKFVVSPMPTGEDFRVNLGSTEVAAIRAEIEADSRASVERAIASIWERFSKVVSHMSASLKDYKPATNGTKAEGTFRDTLVTNISDLLDLIPSLNITQDANITRFASEIRAALTSYGPDELRASDDIRRDVQARADEILAKMSAYVA